MKYLLVIIATISFNLAANENQVISGETRHVEGGSDLKQNFVDQLILKNCDVKLTTFEADSINKVKLSFSDRIFVADNISFTSRVDGTCSVVLSNGYGIK
ncbi:hypothetical protein H5119_01040 [Pseudoalteromonas sp. SG45-5]|uniref:hypothetical protein n=1 Tax=unclassified Pseudoalteromonas TaxID=194690 RepID=UPI0015FB4568|nr:MULTISPECIES: hypothetical protein [unclassified Pseudoalteromonas]MBB1384144.1 hypothetical protein [Pseudoalteromonas sp. SG45-5]MBB1392256.1 hypothetical protein [Pseudoalteromonas sp. SG44-4]MBB1449275.1 hypothetical protein [Pseudoalteromonas sp. SG41-6]